MKSFEKKIYRPTHISFEQKVDINMDSFYDFYLKRKRYEKQCVLGKKINIKLNILPTIYLKIQGNIFR